MLNKIYEATKLICNAYSSQYAKFKTKEDCEKYFLHKLKHTFAVAHTIIDIMMSVEGLNYSDWERNWSKYYNVINIYRCSDDMLFRRESEFMIFFMYGSDSNRYFISDGDLIYSVPKKHGKLFDNMLEEYIQSFLLKL